MMNAQVGVKKERLNPLQLFKLIKEWPMAAQVEAITRTLMNIQSVTDTKGEREIGSYLYRFLKSFSYFQEHPELVWMQEIPNDPLRRKNVFALLKGGKKKSSRTVVWHAHFDTVGTEDYGCVKDKVSDPEALADYFLNNSIDPDIVKDANDSNWLFGRGSVDMKSGIAVHLVNLLHYSQMIESVEGNILVFFNAAEETDHTGIMAVTEELNDIKERQQLDYIVAINNDYTTSLYKEDPHRYLYAGSAGKILPCFAIRGKEAHVGEAFTSIDPTLISSEINRRLNYNMNHTEQLAGELTLPPTCLYQRDNKEIYNVQTALGSRLYFNYFMYERTVDDVMERILTEVEDACEGITDYRRKQQEIFFKNEQGSSDEKDICTIQVWSFADYEQHLRDKGFHTAEIMEETLRQSKETDKRERTFNIVEALLAIDDNKDAKVIVFFAPPFIPHHTLDERNQKERHVLNSLYDIAAEMEKQTNESFTVKKFFPFLSDSSFLGMYESDEEWKQLSAHFPAMEHLYSVPVTAIQQLSLPAVNVGVYGKDAHKCTERVYKPYSYQTLPILLRRLTEQLLLKEKVH